MENFYVGVLVWSGDWILVKMVKVVVVYDFVKISGK